MDESPGLGIVIPVQIVMQPRLSIKILPLKP